MSEHTCHNCQHTFSGKYCNNCGQDAHTGRLDMHSLLHEAWHAFTHTDKGVLLLIKDLAVQPGRTYTDYFSGARKKYFNPIIFFLISFGVLLLINKWVFDFEDYRYHTLNEFGRYYEQAAKSEALIMLPVQVLLTWLFFFRRYNLAQVIVFWLYCIGFINVVAIVLSPFRFAFVHHHNKVEHIIQWIQYIIIAIHLFAVFARGTVNKLLCLLLLIILLVVGKYAAIYTINELGLDEDYPTLWQAIKEIFKF
jgi:hypothetical protein